MLQLPIGTEANFVGVVDLVQSRAVVWMDETLGAEFEYREIPPELAERAAAMRESLIELAVEQDEAALEAYLEGVEPDVETVERCIRAGTVAGAFVPVLCGSAFKNKGVQPLLDAVVAYLPSPVDVPPVRGTEPGREEPRPSAPPATRRPSPRSPSR